MRSTSTGTGRRTWSSPTSRGTAWSPSSSCGKGTGSSTPPAPSRYHLAVLRGWNGKTIVAGQRQGFSEPFQGKIYAMKWDGKTLSEGDPLPVNTSILPVSGGGVYSLSAVAVPRRTWGGCTWTWRRNSGSLTPTGKASISRRTISGRRRTCSSTGNVQPAGRTVPDAFPSAPPRGVRRVGGNPLVVVTEIRKGALENLVGVIESSRVVVLQWDGGGFTERAATPKSDFFYSGRTCFDGRNAAGRTGSSPP